MAMNPDAPEMPSVPPTYDGTQNHDALQMTGAPSTPPDIAAGGSMAEKPGLIAPWWHTLLIVGLILINSSTGSAKLGAVHGSVSRIALYANTFIVQLILVLIIWFGIRSRGVSMSDLIGGRWKTVEEFLLDGALAVGFYVTAAILFFGLRVAVGTIDLHNLQKSLDDTVKMLDPIAPHSYLEAGMFVLLSVSAGLFEEIIFRGYLQRQFSSMARQAAIGIILSGIIFGLAHGYQGPRMMFVLAIFGMTFGMLAHFRKSLRPGMMAHALQDSIAGIGLFVQVLRR
jgi:membrane protease YdiL (CAAX protease family)